MMDLDLLALWTLFCIQVGAGVPIGMVAASLMWQVASSISDRCCDEGVARLATIDADTGSRTRYRLPWAERRDDGRCDNHDRR